MKAKLFTRFAWYLKPYWGKELILMILTSADSLASPYILKIIIDTVFPAHNYSLLIQILFILMGINIVRLGINYFSDYLFAWIGNHVTRDIRMDLFRHLMQLPISFFNKNKEGDLVHRVNSEVNSIQSILTGTVVRLINSSCSVVGLTIMLSILNWRLFLLSMTVTPFIFLNTRWFQPRIQKTVKKSREKDSDVLSFLIERFSNIKLIKSYVRQDYENNKLLKKIGEQIELNIRNVQLTATTRNITLLFTMLVPLLIFGVGGKQVMAGTMTVGALVAFIQYMNRIFDPFRDLMGFYLDAIRASVSMQRIFDIMEVEPEKAEGETNIPVQKDIVFRQVHFSYDQLPVLQDFNFTFRHGKKYALVGGSGCGKSTLTALLYRFYEPQKGNIYMGDREVGKMNIHALRRRIALIAIDRAVNTLKAQAQLPKVGIIGLRLGTFLSLCYTFRQRNIPESIWIEPALKPVDYLRKSLRHKLMKELCTDGTVSSSRDNLMQNLQNNSSIDFEGYEIGPGLYRDLAAEQEKETVAKKLEDVLSYVNTVMNYPPIVLAGICSGAKLALYYARNGNLPVTHVIEMSSPVLRQQEAESKLAANRTKHTLHEYAKKIFQKETWSKLRDGEIHFLAAWRNISKPLHRFLTAKTNVSTQHKTSINPILRPEEKPFGKFQGQMLLIHGEKDPETKPALRQIQDMLRRHNIPSETYVVKDANHSFYSVIWEREIIQAIANWLNSQYY